MAQVTPIFEKDDTFLEKNYRPVSILPTLSKIYERLLSEQLNDHSTPFSMITFLPSEPPMAVKPPSCACRRLEAGSGLKHARRGRCDELKQSI